MTHPSGGHGATRSTRTIAARPATCARRCLSCAREAVGMRTIPRGRPLDRDAITTPITAMSPDVFMDGPWGDAESWSSRSQAATCRNGGGRGTAVRGRPPWGSACGCRAVASGYWPRHGDTVCRPVSKATQPSGERRRTLCAGRPPPRKARRPSQFARQKMSVWCRRRAGASCGISPRAGLGDRSNRQPLTTSSRLYGFPINSYRSGRPRRSRAVRVGFVDVMTQARAWSASCKSQQYAAVRSYGGETSYTTTWGSCRRRKATPPATPS